MIHIFILAIENDEDRYFMIELYQNYKALLYFTAFKIMNDNFIVDEIVQEVIANLIDNIEKVKKIQHSVMPAYLVTCIKRVCYDYIKHKKVESRYNAGSLDNPEFDFEYKDEKSNVLDAVLLKIDVEQLKNVLSKLPEKQRDLLKFKYFLGLSDLDIANIFGINKNSVRQYLTRARRAAYELYKNEGRDE